MRAKALEKVEVRTPKETRPSKLVFYQMRWKRPFTLDQVEDALITLAEVRPRGMVVVEVIGRGGQAPKYLIGSEKRFMPKIQMAMKSHAEITFSELDPEKVERIRPVPVKATSLKLSRAQMTLNTEISSGMIRAGLATLGTLPKGEKAVIQIIIGGAYPPTFAPTEPLDMTASWIDIVLGNVRKASSEQIKATRDKASQYSYDTVIRIGATGDMATGTINSLTGVFRTMSSAGVRVVGREIDPTEIVRAKVPWRMPMRLTVAELAMSLMLPVGEEEYVGAGGVHPLELSLPSWYKLPKRESLIRSYAVAPDPNGGEETKLSISPRDALEHTVILGPTGSGKSTVMLNLIMSDINAGRSVMVIDPKADLINDILARMPEERLKDLVVIDPSDINAVGWNPLLSSRSKSPELVADAILAVIKDIFSENWGIRAQEILSAALITLASTKDATLMWLPSLLTDEDFRRRIISNDLDKIALKPFWDQYDALKESERRTMIESSLNKVRQIMFRPALRNILGQSHPKFKLSELFTKRKIVLVPLNKGLIGADSARLLGSLLVGMTWIEALSRANVPKEKRHMVAMYIDELQDYISLPGSFADSLAQARGLGLAITVAHQYRAQLDSNLREGIDANCRNKIIFGLTGSDATNVSCLSSDLKPVDLMSLARYHIYTNIMAGGRSTDWVSATTMKAPEAIRLPADAKAASVERYGRSGEEVEQEILNALYPEQSKADKRERLDHSENATMLRDLDKKLDKTSKTVVGVRPEPTEG